MQSVHHDRAPLLARARGAFARMVPFGRGAGGDAVVALMPGEKLLVARVEPGAAAGRPRLAFAGEGDAAALAAWVREGRLARARAVLVLRSAERHLLTADRPTVPDEELTQAMRFPLAETFDTEPGQLLCSVQPLPRINDSPRPQVLAVGGQVATVRGHLQALAAAGVRVRSVDVVDSALRGMALLQGADADGWIVLAMVGGDILIGLLWRGDFCALRTLALPVRAPRDEAEFEEHLALHIQRTADHFERQATQLAIRHVLAALPSLSPSARQSVRAALPLQARLFELHQVMDLDEATRTRCAGHNELTALACVAAARLLEPARAAEALS